MLDTSSYMGSSFTHWTTSMVWEQAYEKLIPNYNNVLPKVYTDGTLVPERNLDNTLSKKTLEELRSDWYEMCNEVRVAKGHPAYTYDEYFELGEDFFQNEAEKTMKKNELEIQYSINEMFHSKGVHAVMTCSTAHIYEWSDTELEHFKGFFEESSCGDGWMSEEYMVIAFMEIGGRLFYSYTTFGEIEILPDESDILLSQPEELPELEFNPADNQMSIEEVEPEYIEPEVIIEIIETDPTEPIETEPIEPTEPTETEPTTPTETEPIVTTTTKITTKPTTTAKTEPKKTDPPKTSPPATQKPTSPYENYTAEMKQSMLWYDAFDIGLSGTGAYDDEPYKKWDNAAGYLGWWAGQEFGREMTAEETKALVEEAYATGEYNQWQVSAVIADHFGKEMLMDADGNWYVGDGTISDPDGEW
jgi:hypothetical protein